MLYRLYQPGDFAQLYAIEERCFEPPVRFTRRYLRQIIESRGSATWIAEEDGKPAGFSVVEWTGEREKSLAYIQTIEVAPEYRRRGIGLELLRRAEASAAAAGALLIWLHVDAENEAALQLYRAQGYEQRGRQEHYYARHRAAEIYCKPLGAAGGETSLRAE